MGLADLLANHNETTGGTPHPLLATHLRSPVSHVRPQYARIVDGLQYSRNIGLAKAMVRPGQEFANDLDFAIIRGL